MHPALTARILEAISLIRRFASVMRKLGLGNPDSRLFGDHCNLAGQWDSRRRPGVGTSSRTEEDEDNSVEVFAFTKVGNSEAVGALKWVKDNEFDSHEVMFLCRLTNRADREEATNVLILNIYEYILSLYYNLKIDERK
ncbi:hypothetical protein ACJJTC_010595 [Scirpophaga incertulas]